MNRGVSGFIVFIYDDLSVPMLASVLLLFVSQVAAGGYPATATPWLSVSKQLVLDLELQRNKYNVYSASREGRTALTEQLPLMQAAASVQC